MVKESFEKLPSKSKYYHKTYCGYKVIRVITHYDGHIEYGLKKDYTPIVYINGNQMVKIARHQTTVKKILNNKKGE